MFERRLAVKALGLVGASGMLPLRLLAEPRSPVAGEWQPLFNGRDLEGWTFFHDKVGDRDLHRVVSVDRGVLHFLGPNFDQARKSTMGHVATTKEWSNYHLRLDFRWGERRFAPRSLQRRNSGILYHMGPERDRLFPDCVEFQVEEGYVGDAIMVNICRSTPSNRTVLINVESTDARLPAQSKPHLTRLEPKRGTARRRIRHDQNAILSGVSWLTGGSSELGVRLSGNGRAN